MSTAVAKPELGSPAAERRGVLRNRDFRFFWIGETTSKLGSNVTSVALPLVAVVTLHAGALLVSMLAAAAWLPWLLIGLPAGAWVDRLSRRRVMLWADAASLILFASIPLAAWAGLLSIEQLVGVALLGGVATVFFQTAYLVYFPSLVGEDEMVPANSLVQGSQSATQVAGPGVAGLMAALFGAVSGVLMDAATFLISALCLRSIRAIEPRSATRGERRPLRSEIAEGLRFVAHDAPVRSLTLFGALSNMGLIGYQSLLILFLVRDVGLGPGIVGALIATTSLGGVLGASVAGRIGRRLGTARGLLTCLLVGCPAALLIPLTGPGPRLALFILGSVILVAAVVAGNVLQNSWRPIYCPRELYGRITTSSQLLNYGAIPIGALIAGGLASALGIRPTLWIMTAVVAVAPIVVLLSPLRRLRDLPPAPAGGN